MLITVLTRLAIFNTLPLPVPPSTSVMVKSALRVFIASNIYLTVLILVGFSDI